MEQKQINIIIIAGLVVAGVGTWAGPFMTVQTANQFLNDLQNLETLQVGFLTDQDFNFDQFGLGFLKDDVFLDVSSQFLAPPPIFGGPIIDLIAFEQLLIPPDVTGVAFTTPGAVNTFTAPITMFEYSICDTADNFAGAVDLLDECQPAVLDKLFIQSATTERIRVQVAVCEDANYVNNQRSTGDNNPANDRCGPDAGVNAFNNAIIVADVTMQRAAGKIQTLILPPSAIPPLIGNGVLVRVSEEGGVTHAVNVWLGIQRVGDQGAFSFINPIDIGGAPPAACIEFSLLNNNVALGAGDAGVFMEIFGFTFFQLTDVNGEVRFDPVPNGFAIVDVNVLQNQAPFNNAIFFLDRPVSDADHNIATFPNNANADAICNETVFDLLLG